MGNPTVLIIAGEVSGDMHAARVVAEVKKHRPEVDFFGIGGEEMRSAGVDTVFDVKDMAVMGFSEVFRRLDFFRNVFEEMAAMARRRDPDVVILVDYPGFNLRFASEIKRMRCKIIYYICPQVWAWNQARIPKMARVIDRLITIFPFEEKYFAETGLQVDFVGHPLVDEAAEARKEPDLDLPWKGDPRLALLPGSRPDEVRRILPAMWSAAAAVERKHPSAGFIVAAPSKQIEEVVRAQVATLGRGPSSWATVAGATRQVLRQATAAVVASGTATIETSLMRCPMVVVYKVAPLTYLLGRMVVKVSDIGMVNIVAGKRVCPKLVQRRASPSAIARAVEPLLSDSPGRRDMLDELDRVNISLGEGGSARRAADVILETLAGPKREKTDK